VGIALRQWLLPTGSDCAITSKRSPKRWRWLLSWGRRSAAQVVVDGDRETLASVLAGAVL
jgi:hypothetical protein